MEALLPLNESPELYDPADYYDYDESENSTMCDYSEWEPSYSVIPVLYMLIFVLGLSGNGVVIFAVWRTPPGRRRAADVYIGNLAAADLTFVLTLPLWAVYTALGYHWPFGAALCKLSSYVVLLNMYASVFCLTAMSFDRYLAIVRSAAAGPAARLRSRGHMLASLAAIWTVSGALAVPALVFRDTQHNGNRTQCGMDFGLVVREGDARTEARWVAGLSLSSSVLGFLLPFAAMTVCYCFIGATVARHFATSSAVCKEDRRRRRLLKIIAALVAVFAACWTPFHLVKSADAFSYLELAPGTCAFLRFLLLAHPYATCLAYVNSCLNPFLYAFFDLRFRAQCLCLLNLKKALHDAGSGGGGGSGSGAGYHAGYPQGAGGNPSSLSSQKTEAMSLATKV